MRIVVANKMDWAHPKKGGVEVHLREVLERLSSRGHDIHLITARYPDSKKKECINGITIHRIGSKRHTNEGYVLTLGQVKFNFLLWKLDPDVLFSNHSMLTWIPLTNRKNHVTAYHRLTGKESLSEYGSLKGALGYLLETISLKLARNRESITVSRSLTKKLVDQGFSEEKIIQVQNGIDHTKYDVGKESSNPQLLYLGRLEHSKGADRLEEVNRGVKENINQPYNFLISGKGSMNSEIEAVAERNPEVKYCGYLSEKEKVKALQESWICVMPSRIEGWGLVAAEALATKTPVVASKTGGLNELLEDQKTGILVEKNLSSYRIGECAAELIEKYDKREKMAENGRKFTESLNWDKTTDKIEEILRIVSKY